MKVASITEGASVKFLKGLSLNIDINYYKQKHFYVALLFAKLGFLLCKTHQDRKEFKIEAPIRCKSQQCATSTPLGKTL